MRNYLFTFFPSISIFTSKTYDAFKTHFPIRNHQIINGTGTATLWKVNWICYFIETLVQEHVFFSLKSKKKRRKTSHSVTSDIEENRRKQTEINENLIKWIFSSSLNRPRKKINESKYFIFFSKWALIRPIEIYWRN